MRGCVQVNSLALLLKRETGLGDPGCSGFSRSQRQHLTVLPSGLPTTPCRLMDSMDSRAYIGQFSRDGAFFVVGYQDQRVRLYDVEEGWKLRKDVRARGIRWTITDTCVSPDQRYLLYASINPTVHLVAVGSGGSDNVVESVANITEVHEALDFDPSRHTFGIWSVRWSGDGREIIAGTNNRSVYIYDLGESKVVARVAGHADDVNA
ncbi:WD_REPEATS_REGION domain-containing protein, partial [Haematococcus lacustris]